MVFAFIYEGTSDFHTVGGYTTIYEPSGEIRIELDNPDHGQTFCSICTIRTSGEEVQITKEERYFKGHPDADRYYGFGFSWRPGSK